MFNERFRKRSAFAFAKYVLYPIEICCTQLRVNFNRSASERKTFSLFPLTGQCQREKRELAGTVFKWARISRDFHGLAHKSLSLLPVFFVRRKRC